MRIGTWLILVIVVVTFWGCASKPCPRLKCPTVNCTEAVKEVFIDRNNTIVVNRTSYLCNSTGTIEDAQRHNISRELVLIRQLKYCERMLSLTNNTDKAHNLDYYNQSMVDLEGKFRKVEEILDSIQWRYNKT